MNIEEQLRTTIKGQVFFDAIHKIAYSVDASIYEIEPICVVVPLDISDIVATVAIANEYKVPIIPRGAATGITGGCIGKGIVLDTSRFLNRILHVDYANESTICQPGVVQNRLNEALSLQGYRLGPDTSTGDRATLAGMLANNAAGSRSLRYGRMVDHVESVTLCLASGELLTFSALDETAWNQKLTLKSTEGHIYREMTRIAHIYRNEIETRFPHIPRRVSGYNLDHLLDPFPRNLAKLVAGSEGTLGVITEITMRIAKKPITTGICVIHLSDVIQGMRYIPDMLAFHPLSLEMIDERILQAGRTAPSMRGKLDWISGHPAALFLAEFDGNNTHEVEAKIDAFEQEMRRFIVGTTYTRLLDPASVQHAWDVRKAGLGLLLSKRSYSRAIAFIEDISVAPNHLAPFMENFIAYMKSVGKEAGIYGHVGSGCMHIRPYIDLRQADDLHLMKKIMLDITAMLAQHSGALSGEHGDGFIRSWLNPLMFGNALYQAFQEVKNAFDPLNLMNPGKIVNGPPLEHNLRNSPSTPQKKIETFLDFSQEGGFELAVDLCNGNGLCRKSEKIMCPSFQATQNEFDTTRARAQALRAVIHNKLPSLPNSQVAEVLDLCLECKGCKSECPSQVDMAKMKAEFLFQYQEKHGYPLRSRLLAHIAEFNYLASFAPRLANTLTTLSKPLLTLLGIAPNRPLPKLAHKTFSHFLKNHAATPGPNVVLFNDTFTEYNCPEIGISALNILTQLGYNVIVPPWHCCGRPLISKGFLKLARKKANALIQLLKPYAEQNIPIIGLEPSCILTIKDDFNSLSTNAQTIASACTTFDEFIHKHNLNIQSNDNILLHGHCHQKALSTMTPTLATLKNISPNATEIPSGCCGMAGSFGYESEHSHLSLKIAELVLLPVVRQASAESVIIANGFSCRTQIQHGTGRTAMHLAEYLWKLRETKGELVVPP